MRQPESASATKPSYEEVTTCGRAAEPNLAVGGAEASDIDELRLGYVPLHARVREKMRGSESNRKRTVRSPVSAGLSQYRLPRGLARSCRAPSRPHR